MSREEELGTSLFGKNLFEYREEEKPERWLIVMPLAKDKSRRIAFETRLTQEDAEYLAKCLGAECRRAK